MVVGKPFAWPQRGARRLAEAESFPWRGASVFMKKVDLVAVLMSMSGALLGLSACSNGGDAGGGGGGVTPPAGQFACVIGGPPFCSIASELCFIETRAGALENCFTDVVECRPLPTTPPTCEGIKATLPATDNGSNCWGDPEVGFTAQLHRDDC
jgi:hypothetical protein